MIKKTFFQDDCLSKDFDENLENIDFKKMAEVFYAGKIYE
jgi:hypothetical protein